MENNSICYKTIYKNISDINFDINNTSFEDNLDFILDKFDRILESQPLELKLKNQPIGPKIFFRSILTDFMVNDVISNNKEELLIDIINKIMTSLLDAYYKKTNIKVRFVYRGGNILNIYKNNFDFLIPGIASILSKEFNRFFKKSDLDFYLVVGNRNKYNEKQLNQINKEVQALSYYGLVIARDIIYTKDIFNLCNYNFEHVSKLFEELLNEMNENKGNSDFEFVRNAEYIGLGFNKFYYLKDKNIDPLNLPKLDFVFDEGNMNTYETFRKKKKSGHFDMIINRTEEKGVISNSKNSKLNQSPTGLMEIYKVDTLDKDLFFNNEEFGELNERIMEDNEDYPDYYISNNFDIKSDELNMHFRLSRIMINFNLTYKTNNGYGMVNVPSELYDISVSDFGDRALPIYNFSALTKFNYEYVDEGELKENTIYIPKMQTMIKDLDLILFFAGLPWDDEKYQKRLIRFIIMIFILSLTKMNILEVRKLLVKMLKNKSINYNEKYEFGYLKSKMIELDEVVTNGKDRKEYNLFIETIKDTVNELIEIIDKIKKYVKDKGLLNKKLLKKQI